MKHFKMCGLNLNFTAIRIQCNSLYFALACLMCCSILGCRQGKDANTDTDAWVKYEEQLRAELATLNEESTAGWDTIQELIAADLDSIDITEGTRKNMVGARNGGLIRMFEAYHGLSEETKKAIHRVEKRDSMISRQVLRIRTQLDSLMLQAEAARGNN